MRLRLVGFGTAVMLLASTVAPVAAQSAGTGTVPGDSSATSVNVDPNGPAGVSTVGVQGTTSDSGGPGSIVMGTQTGGSTSAPCPLAHGRVHLTDAIPLPAVKIDSGPPATTGAVVGVPTWFWADGYSGDWWKPKGLAGYYWTCALNPDGSQNWRQIPVTIPVVVWAAHYLWDFGDGSKPHEGWCGTSSQQKDCADTALGVPDTPKVNNTYTSSSAGLAQGYKVTVAVSFMAELNGQAVVGPYTQGDSIFLPVREIQSVLVPVPAP